MAGHIVVGIDGSPESGAALRFAHEEARLRGALLRLVCVWSASGAAYAGEVFAPTEDAFLEAEHHAEEILRAAVASLGSAPGIEVEAIVVEGHAVTELVERAAGDDLLVIGSRGRGAAASLVLGSVSQGVAHHARCPVVIVPPRR